jgi:hypothetical protein
MLFLLSADPGDPPLAQRIAAIRAFDLDHLGAEIGQLQAQHVAGDEPREIEHAHAVERTFCLRAKGPHAHRLVTSAPNPGARG